jgi:predicted MFS family arabinose efflux permease
MSGQVIGLISGQLMAGFFADHFGWRWAFALLGAIYLWVGLRLLASLHRHRQPVATADSLVGASASGRIGLVLGNAHARVILAVVFFESMTSIGVIAFVPTFLHHRFDLSLFHAGAITATFGLGGLGYTLFARRWVRKLGQGRLAVLGGALMGAAFLLLILAPAWGLAVVACMVAGLGFYQLHNTLQTMATQMTPAARGTAVSIFASCFFLGQAVGVSVGAMVVDHVSARWLFAAAAVMLPLLGTFLSRYLRSSAHT